MSEVTGRHLLEFQHVRHQNLEPTWREFVTTARIIDEKGHIGDKVRQNAFLAAEGRQS